MSEAQATAEALVKAAELHVQFDRMTHVLWVRDYGQVCPVCESIA